MDFKVIWSDEAITDLGGATRHAMAEEFISAAIQPVAGTLEATRMDRGEPGLPRQFRWKLQTIQVVEVLRTWRETGPCHHGSGEKYARKHWFEVLTDSGATMKIYFERQARAGRDRKRWRLFTIERPQLLGRRGLPFREHP